MEWISTLKNDYLCLKKLIVILMVKIRIQGESLSEEKSDIRIVRSLLLIVGIPLFWLIIYAFFQRKRSICIQKFGPEDCKKSPLSHVFLVIAIFLNLFAILRIKFYKNHFINNHWKWMLVFQLFCISYYLYYLILYQIC